jgi:hypothetical protein
MNLHTVVAPVVAAVNPMHPVTLKTNTGTVKNPDFSRTPTYTSSPMNAQIQGMSSDDIRLVANIGLQGTKRKIYLWGAHSGMIRSLRKGNDLIVFPDRSEWKVAVVTEDYGHGVDGETGWCSVIAVLQNPTSEG